MLSKYESVCLDLSNLLIDETESLQSLSKDFSGMGTEPFNIEDYISFCPIPEEEVAGPSKPPLHADDVAVEGFLNDL